MSPLTIRSKVCVAKSALLEGIVNANHIMKQKLGFIEYGTVENE